MTYKISGIKTSINNKQSLLDLVEGILEFSIKNLKVLRRSIDARKKNQDIFFIYNFSFSTDKILSDSTIKKHSLILVEEKNDDPLLIISNKIDKNKKIYICGSGPAGLFSALTLVKHGLEPIILEKGKQVEERTLDVADFWKNGNLNSNSNIQFGEGGAGTFSDGKLTNRSKSSIVLDVLKTLINSGADESIKWDSMAHLGTDNLAIILTNIREYLISKGCQFLFKTELTDVKIKDNKLEKIILNNTDEVSCSKLILAPGHSSRNLFRKLYSSGVNIERKDFAVGFRVEHPQELINTSQYGKFANHEKLSSASYSLTYKNNKNIGGVYSFCMCPGGNVLNAASSDNTIVTNGMSSSARDGLYANSGIVISVNSKITGESVFSGLEYQERIENEAFLLANKTYKLPSQRVSDYLYNKQSKDLPNNSALGGSIIADLSNLYQKEINLPIKMAIKEFSKKIRGFDSTEALLFAPETRTSSPIRITRDKETFESTSIKGIFPVGEGAGYAGGIVSSAVDGIRVTEKLIESL